MVGNGKEVLPVALEKRKALYPPFAAISLLPSADRFTVENTIKRKTQHLRQRLLEDNFEQNETSVLQPVESTPFNMQDGLQHVN
ncbi:MAG TPA: hypothetical protein VIM16_01660 [Mucilaginibacter sp.]|jgi:hypothetical protein